MDDETFELELQAWLERTVDPEKMGVVRERIDEAIIRLTDELGSAFKTGVKLKRKLRIGRKTRSDIGKSNPLRSRKRVKKS